MPAPSPGSAPVQQRFSPSNAHSAVVLVTARKTPPGTSMKCSRLGAIKQVKGQSAGADRNKVPGKASIQRYGEVPAPSSNGWGGPGDLGGQQYESNTFSSTSDCSCFAWFCVSSSSRTSPERSRAGPSHNSAQKRQRCADFSRSTKLAPQGKWQRYNGDRLCTRARRQQPGGVGASDG